MQITWGLCNEWNQPLLLFHQLAVRTIKSFFPTLKKKEKN